MGRVEFLKLYKSDVSRYRVKGEVSISLWQRCFHYFLRKSQTEKNGLLVLIYRYAFRIIKAKHCIDFSSYVKVGEGLYIGHPFGITVNADTIIGRNCNIHRGVLLGQENRGRRKGTPTIGDNVWIGVNACVVGHVLIGNDVLIAPNSYVNCDVPDHSVVFGNPCVIKHVDNATQGYINNTIEIN